MNKLSKDGKVDYVDSFLKGVIEICENINQKDIDKVIDLFFQAWWNQNNIFFIGNGGSAGTAMHFAGDLVNTTANIPHVPPVRALSLNDNMVRFSALVNDQGWENVYVEQLKTYFKPGDILAALSVHGGSGKDKAGLWSQNLTAALKYAKDSGGKTVGFAGFDGGAFKNICDVCVVVPYNTTPHVEGFHVVLHHLIFDQLTSKIKNAAKALKNY